MLGSDAFSNYELNTREKKDEFVETFYDLLEQWHNYKDSKAGNNRQYYNTGSQQSAVRLDDVIFKLAQPGIRPSDKTKDYFLDLVDEMKRKNLIRNARNFDNSIYEGHTSYFEFTPYGYDWRETGSEPALSEATGQYIENIRNSLEAGTATDLEAGLDYLEEGHLAFFELTQPLLKCSLFMIGAASEFLVSKVYAELQANYSISPGTITAATVKLNDLTNYISVRANRNKISSKATDPNKAEIIIRELHGILTRIGHVIRMDRNDVGHPSAHNFTKDEVKAFFGEMRHLYQKGSLLYRLSSIP